MAHLSLMIVVLGPGVTPCRSLAYNRVHRPGRDDLEELFSPTRRGTRYRNDFAEADRAEWPVSAAESARRRTRYCDGIARRRRQPARRRTARAQLPADAA